MRAIAVTVAALALTAAACGDNGADDVVQQTPQGAQEVSETKADIATTRAAVAFGMTRQQLEDSELLAPNLSSLGDVETLVIDAQGRLTHVVVDLDGGDDQDVVVPVADITSVKTGDGRANLQTPLTTAQLQALPKWTGAGATAGTAPGAAGDPAATSPAA